MSDANALVDYTVVGYYDDNGQPFCHGVQATHPDEAALKAAVECGEGELCVVEVLTIEDNKIIGVYENDNVMSREDMGLVPCVGCARWFIEDELDSERCQECVEQFHMPAK